MTKTAPLGFHGVVLSARDPQAVTKRLQRLLSLPVLARGRAEILLGNGPEFFIAIHRRKASETVSLEEIHVAVERISKTRRRTVRDPLGGDSWSRPVTRSFSVTVREFQRPPSEKWRRTRARV